MVTDAALPRGLARDLHAIADKIQFPGAGSGGLLRKSEELRRLHQPALRLDKIVDVDRCDDPFPDRAGTVDRRHLGLVPSKRPVATEDANMPLLGNALAIDLFERGCDRPEVVAMEVGRAPGPVPLHDRHIVPEAGVGIQKAPVRSADDPHLLRKIVRQHPALDLDELDVLRRGSKTKIIIGVVFDASVRDQHTCPRNLNPARPPKLVFVNVSLHCRAQALACPKVNFAAAMDACGLVDRL